MRKKPEDEVFQISLKFPRSGWDQRLADSTEDGIAEKLFTFRNKFVVIYNLLIWNTELLLLFSLETPCCTFFVCVTESSLKMMKNAFYFILKALFVLKLFRFLSWLFGHIEKNDLIRKIKLISNFMTSQPGSCRIWGKETSSRPVFVF